MNLKRDENGFPARFEGRLVAMGNFQSDQLGLVEVYSPVTCIEAVRIILEIAYARGWKPHHIHIKGAFLYAMLSESDDIWIKLPDIDGVSSANGQIVKLRKSLYGLRQAPKLWYQHLSSFLKKYGFRRSRINDCLFLKDTANGEVYLLVYVDDILLFGELEDLNEVKSLFKANFTTTDLGVFRYFLGIKIEYTNTGIFLSQRPFIEKIIRLAELESAKPTETPLPLTHFLYDKVT